MVSSKPHRPIQRDAEGFADGAVGFCVGGPEGVGGVLDGGAAAVDGVEEGVAIDAGELLVFGGFLLLVLGAEVGGEEVFDGFDEFRGLVAGEAVFLGAGMRTSAHWRRMAQLILPGGIYEAKCGGEELVEFTGRQESLVGWRVAFTE